MRHGHRRRVRAWPLELDAPQKTWGPALLPPRDPQTARRFDVPAATVSNRWGVTFDAYQM